MKKVCTLIMLITLSFNEMSCTNQNTNNDSSDFSLSDKKMGFTKDDLRVSGFTFEYSGDIANETKNIYNEARVIMTLEFTLENGRVLTDVDMNPAKEVFGAAEAFEIIYSYQPDQVYTIKDLQTDIISEDYLKYPIKSVTASFKIEFTDDINNTNGEEDLKSEDITDKWTQAVSGNFGQDFHDAEVDSTNATIKN
jgi:hypothetical protein